jgi:hypothetical protein
VLEILSNKGNFYFSYNSSLIKKDSLITFSAYNKSVKEILDFIFKPNYEYKESGNYIILRRAPIKITLLTSQAITEDKFYAVSGYVQDEETGEKLADASVYEKERLVSSLTNKDGFFKIKLKARYKKAALTVSKEFYEDTTVIINPKYNQQLTITIIPVAEAGSTITVSPEDYLAPDSIIVEQGTDASFMRYTYRKTDSVKVEKTRMGKFLLSAKQKVESVNLSKFFTVRPYQISFLPPLSTNGGLNAQVVNKVSLNILGGYSAGVNGAEFGGWFNINKKNMRGLQVAGTFNLVGGSVYGVQYAGIHNTVLDSMYGLQTAGISNYTKGKINGWQMAGIHNHASDTVRGVQIAGITNYANKKITGLQLAGIGNFSRRRMNGWQVAGIFNYSTYLHGVQIGLINVADSSDGYSIGLFNFVRKNGYHKISLYANEVINTNITIKTGNAKLYSMLIGGINIGDSAQAYSFGFGLGHDFMLSKKTALSAEISSQQLYLGSWDYANVLNKFKLNLNWQLTKNTALFAGPSFNAYYSNQTSSISGYKTITPSNNFSLGKNLTGWVGWSAGITFL